MGDRTAAAEDAIGAFLGAHRDEMVGRLSAWVEIPSVSADPKRRLDGVWSAHWIAAELRDAGFTTTRRTETTVVVGEKELTPKERVWVRSALEVSFLLAGDPEGIEHSVIPREAMASLSIRTVADQRNHDVADALRAFIAGTGLPEDHWHASDESIDLRMLVRGAATLAHLWRELAAAS
jgi:acetylornithine deacetylase/succinyl-diaminopimelate desuccinylase-like protein